MARGCPPPTVQRDLGLRADVVPGRNSQRRPPFPVGTKDRECPPRCLVSLKTGPEDTSPSHDPAGGRSAVVQGTSPVLLALYAELPRRGKSVRAPPCWEEQEPNLPPPKPALAEPRVLRTSCKASRKWPGGECHPSAHWAEDVNSHLVTRSGRMQNSMGIPSTLRALHHEVDMLGAGGDLCRAEGPGSSSPKGCGHPVTRMNVTSRVCVCVCGGAGY